MSDDQDEDARKRAADESAALERIERAFLLPLTLDPGPPLAGTPDVAEPAAASTAASGAAAVFPGGASPSTEEPQFLFGTDVRLFRLAAAQTGLALENSILVAQVASEIAARQKHERELEIARDVQQRLFPQAYPPVAGLEYAGACRPAFEVGGDYYDFITLSESTFGIAIGDVSGKGIPASLLMATLRAYLRGQTAGRTVSLPSLMTNLNQFVYDSSPANRYATFFYAQHDTSTREVTYVNGGHNPPLLFRAGDLAADASPIRLDAGGTVIGLLPECGYVQGQVVLDAGDLLVAFTDGVSEATNAADEEWGETRLIETIRRHRELPAAALIDRIMAAVDAFAGDTTRQDDMTLVIVRAVDGPRDAGRA